MLTSNPLVTLLIAVAALVIAVYSLYVAFQKSKKNVTFKNPIEEFDDEDLEEELGEDPEDIVEEEEEEVEES